MLWGKLIDHERCIGCHACSVACKSENQVPLGVFRTWVKQVEKGAGQQARRHFGVLRCNQCDDAPCVAICPTAAMHRRPDGIVDFDSEVCIGCKGCIQACPYDAIYIDPVEHTAAKCNFCAHRLEVGLEPACVAACPTGALVVSDLEDAESPVARAVARFGVRVRKPELGTQPKVFYRGADECVLDPLAAERPAGGQGVWGVGRQVDPAVQPKPGAARRPGAPAAARVAYDVPREGSPWGSAIALYLTTKAVGAGALLVGGLGLLLHDPRTLGIWPPLLGLVGLALTMLLLVADLKRPERFMLLLLRPQPRSWLVKGAYVLILSALLAAVWGAALLAGPATLPDWGWQALGVGALLAGASSSGYTAFLFGQARGRQLWQSPLLLPHLVVQAGVAGSAVLALVPGLLGSDALPPAIWGGRLLALGGLLGAFLALNLLMLLGELWSHSGEEARLAVRWMTQGGPGTNLSLGVFGLGHVFPAVALAAAFLAPGAEPAVALAAIAALSGLAIWDHLYVQAGQVPPLS